MNWVKFEDELPDEEKMVLCRTINEPIVNYVVASWDENSGTFVDYDDNGFAASHWCYIDNPE